MKQKLFENVGGNNFKLATELGQKPNGTPTLQPGDFNLSTFSTLPENVKLTAFLDIVILYNELLDDVKTIKSANDIAMITKEFFPVTQQDIDSGVM